MPARYKGTLKDNILRYLKDSKTAVPFSVLYKNFPAHTKNGIRVSIYKLMKEGLVEKVSHERPVTYRAK
jgi:hypothetical protein